MTKRNCIPLVDEVRIGLHVHSVCSVELGGSEDALSVLSLTYELGCTPLGILHREAFPCIQEPISGPQEN